MPEPAALIALIEDEEHLAQGLIYNLEAEGFTVHHEADGEAGLAWLLDADPQPAAILLDVMLPGRDGFSIAQALREAGKFTPILMLTARGRAEDVVEGFAAGADDYLAKPFDLNVLLARVSALLRRMNWQGSKTVEVAAPSMVSAEINGRMISFNDLEVSIPEQGENAAAHIHLTLMEADLLRYLLERPGKIVPRKEILENVWHVHEDTDTRAIDNFIVRLRRYIETDPTSPRHLQTVRGVGYRFSPTVEPYTAPAGVHSR